MGCFLDNVALSHFGLYKATETKKKEAEKASTEDGDDKKKNKEKVSDDEGVEEEEPEDKPKQPQEGEKEAADGEQQREGEDNKKKKQEAKAEEGKETERRYGAPMGWEDFYHFTIGHKVRDERVSLYTYDRHMLAEALVD
jgi:cobalamin biosynthesis protein CobT